MSRQLELGSKHAADDTREPQIKSVALVQMIAVLTLALSTLIAATAVSIGLAHADVPAYTAAPFTDG
jgi:hypothetical protein